MLWGYGKLFRISPAWVHGIFFGITKRTNKRVGCETVCRWFYVPAFVWVCGLQHSLLAHFSLLWHNVPFIYNLVYINRLKTAPIHACLQSVKNTHSRSFIHSHELMRKLESTRRELKTTVHILTLTLSHWLQPDALHDAYSFALNSDFFLSSIRFDENSQSGALQADFRLNRTLYFALWSFNSLFFVATASR